MRLNRALRLKFKELKVTQHYRAVVQIQYGCRHVFSYCNAEVRQRGHRSPRQEWCHGGSGNYSHMLVLFLARRALFSPPFNSTFLSAGVMKTPVTTCSISFKEVHDWLAVQ